MTIKIINALLMLTAAAMGIKQGYAMLSTKPEMLKMFAKWDIGAGGVMIFGAVTLVSAVLILIPRAFLWGNFLMAATILLILCFQLQDKNLKGAAVEVPFLLLNLVIIFLRHPFDKTS